VEIKKNKKIMNDIQLFKEKQINDYLSNIDLLNMNISQMKSELKSLLGEEPAIKLNYVNDKMITEDGNSEKIVERLDTVTIIYTINKELIPGKEMPFPISKTFIVG